MAGTRIDRIDPDRGKEIFNLAVLQLPPKGDFFAGLAAECVPLHGHRMIDSSLPR